MVAVFNAGFNLGEGGEAGRDQEVEDKDAYIITYRFSFIPSFFAIIFSQRNPTADLLGRLISCLVLPSFGFLMVSTVNGDFNFRRLLRNICAQFFLPPSRYGITVVADGQLCSYVDVEVPRSSRFMKIITCWGSSFSDSERSDEDAARVAIKRLSAELGFEVKDVSYDEKIIYKELYERISDEHIELQNEHVMLKVDFDLLKKTYNILIEKHIVAELKEIKDGIARCCILINHPSVGWMDVESTAEAATLGDVETTATTEEDPEAPLGYYKI